MTVKGGSRPACAACRFQRRRCSPDCLLAPYFPANEPKIFQNVHSLYGVGHIMKILNQLQDDEQREEAMTSIKYESKIRQINRVHGCYGLIVQLHKKIVESIQELRHILFVLDSYKKNHELPNSVNEMKNNNVQVVGGSSDWISAMINGSGSDLGFYYNHALNDQTDMTQNQCLFDEFQQYCNVEEHGEGSQNYADLCGSFVDHHQHQQSFMGSKETREMKLESPDASYYSESGEVKVAEKLFQDTRSLG